MQKWDGEGEDFNMTLRSEERNGRNVVVSDTNVFKEMIGKLELADLPLSGGQWNWTNMKKQPACSQIDRFLVYPGFLLQLSGVCQKILQRLISDHYSFCLVYDGVQ